MLYRNNMTQSRFPPQRIEKHFSFFGNHHCGEDSYLTSISNVSPRRHLHSEDGISIYGCGLPRAKGRVEEIVLMIINLYNLIYIQSCAGEKRINKHMGVPGKYLIIYYVSIYGTYFIVPIC